MGYQRSLRQYAEMLYATLPPSFEIRLRGDLVEHRNIASDLKFKQTVVYKPKLEAGAGSGSQEQVTIKIGFVKELQQGMSKNVFIPQGINIYCRNRLIKPMWQLHQGNSSVGRGVVGVLEVNFIEPAHDKQDFERTPSLLKLEERLKKAIKDFWNANAHRVGYSTRVPKEAVPKSLPAALTNGASSSPQNGNKRKRDDDSDSPDLQAGGTSIQPQTDRPQRERKPPGFQKEDRDMYKKAYRARPGDNEPAQAMALDANEDALTQWEAGAVPGGGPPVPKGGAKKRMRALGQLTLKPLLVTLVLAPIPAEAV